MPKTLACKIIDSHLVDGENKPGAQIGIRIDQTLTQDATGTLVYLEFESLGLDRVKTKGSYSYVDHNTLQSGFENADDHLFLQSAAARFGALFSRPGNGICHQVHLERFARPGWTLLGSDSHTPTAGGLGMLAVGAGGIDVAAAMAGAPFYVTAPEVFNVKLLGSLPPWVGAKDVILAVLRRLTVKGGVGRVIEYSGPGVAELDVPQRATIANMGAELGATSSIFPSDERTQRFLRAQKRASHWKRLAADAGARYDGELAIELSALEPLVAVPHSPDNVVPVTKLAGKAVDQVCIGSCTNSSYRDLMTLAAMLDGKTVHPNVSLVVSPGSRQVLEMIAANGALATIIKAGARILESACGPCIGMGQAPRTGGVTLRTFNRNFKGRCGTEDAGAYLSGVEVAAASAVAGTFADPRKLGRPVRVSVPRAFHVDDSMILKPPRARGKVKIERGPNIKPLPKPRAVAERLSCEVLLVAGDNVTTDDILPGGAKVLALRSNIGAISRYVFSRMDPTFAERARHAGAGCIVGGQNYGQGSSREHAALAPMYLGIRVVIARSFARIHRSNLINFGILPLVLPEGEKAPDRGDRLDFKGLKKAVRSSQRVTATVNGARKLELELTLGARERQILLSGGLLGYVKSHSG